MSLSDDLSQLIQGLRHAGASGRQLQFDLLRHLTQCVQQLTSSLEEDVMLPSDNAAPDGTGEQLAEAPSEEENIVRALESPGGLACPSPINHPARFDCSSVLVNSRWHGCRNISGIST